MGGGVRSYISLKEIFLTSSSDIRNNSDMTVSQDPEPYTDSTPPLTPSPPQVPPFHSYYSPVPYCRFRAEGPLKRGTPSRQSIRSVSRTYVQIALTAVIQSIQGLVWYL